MSIEEFNKADDKLQANICLIKGDEIEEKILEKIKFQWKTLRKAFMNLNIEKTGKISKREFMFYLDFWGITISEQKFNQIFSKFDLDGDGLISYKDF
jgi:Ca2+-binding EF-hand superfamily protein